LGQLVKKQLGLDLENIKLKEIELDDQLIPNLKRKSPKFELFKQENKTNALFYRNSSDNVNFLTLDSTRQVVAIMPNIFKHVQVSYLIVKKSGDNFAIEASLLGCESTCFFRDHAISPNGCRSLLIIADSNLNLLNYKPMNSGFYLAANSSHLLCIDRSYKVSYYDSNLDSAFTPKLAIDNERTAGVRFHDIEMSDEYLFMLGDDRLLRIFELEEFARVKEISVDADQMKLVSGDYLAVFSTTSGRLCLYGQFDDFSLEKEIEIDFEEEIDDDDGLMVARDKTRSLTLYNSTKIKYFDFD
jgi:hypothetical protein